LLHKGESRKIEKTLDAHVNKTLTTPPWHWLPPLITLSLVLALHVDVPYYDQWDLLPLLDAYYQGTLQWQDLLQPHNGHILLLPKIVMLGLAILTQWNTLAEVLFSFICMLINWFLLQKIAGILLGRAPSITEKITISLLVFSLSQAQNWLWGWQLQIPLALLLILSGICSLLCIRNNCLALVAATICGAAATVSFAGSLPFWLAVIPVLWQRQRILLLPWLLISSTAVFTYAYLLALSQHSSVEPTFLLSATEIFRHTKNTLALLGNLVAHFDMLAAILVGFSATVIVSLQYSRLSSRQKNLALALLLFSAGSALLVSLSRSGLGDEQMLASRYATLTLPFWITTAVLLMTSHCAQPIRNSICLLLLASLLLSDVYSFKEFQQLHNRLQRGHTALARIDSIEGRKQIAVINPRKDQEQALQEALLLRQYHLSFYRHDEP
ncbi:MAG TPA: hypothetical protein VLB90_02195, partial [Pseudomonadales bacterium]|nr:hypothetical protein [Pseudomonadales bacterium]